MKSESIVITSNFFFFLNSQMNGLSLILRTLNWVFWQQLTKGKPTLTGSWLPEFSRLRVGGFGPVWAENWSSRAVVAAIMDHV